MKSKSVIFSIVMILTVIACEEKDAPVLEGDIHGTVSLIDGYGYSLTDKSGIQVQLTGQDTELEATTDSDGHYIFQDIPFGNYHINLIRENYVEKNLNFSFGHIGGDAPTILNSQVMNEIPEFSYGIDSMVYYPYHFNIYMHTIGSTRTFANSFFYVHCFFSQSPDVSCENYENSFLDFKSEEDDIYWTFWGGYYNFLDDYSGTVYCRVYPQTYCDDMWYSNNTAGPHPVYQETLGTPSEVFSFTVEGITRTYPDL
jgi:hypothetical protein